MHRQRRPSFVVVEVIKHRKHRAQNIRPSLLHLEARNAPASFAVTNAADSGIGSLRSAITLANVTPGFDTITFAVGSGQVLIRPTFALPTISDAVTIDGTTQPGFSGKPLVELDGSMALGVTNGLTITASNVLVRGLVINHFSQDGVNIAAGTGGYVTLQGNYIGTDVTGSFDAGNGVSGIACISGNNIQIGGGLPGQANLASGNGGAGIAVLCKTVFIEGNLVGTDITGTKSIPNDQEGIKCWQGAGNVRIGTNADGVNDAAERNLVSGNKGDGIGVYSNGTYFPTFEWKTSQGGNGHFYVFTPGTTWIAAEANAQTADGHLASINSSAEWSFVRIAGQSLYTGGEYWIGLSDLAVEGKFAWTTGEPFSFSKWGGGQPDNAGGLEDFVSMNVVTGLWNDLPSTATAASIIEFNSAPNLEILASLYSPPDVIAGNLIGSDVLGKTAIPNAGHGVRIENSVGIVMGGHGPGAGNLISGNKSDGIYITGNSTRDAVIMGNLIGTDLEGNMALPNMGRGVTITNGAGSVRIGTDGNGINDVAEQNVISGNGADGIVVSNTGSWLSAYRWLSSSGGNDHYYVLIQPRTWKQSEAIAALNGGHLASITSAVEQQFINSNVLSKFRESASMWIGLTDEVTEGKYLWTSGEPYAYSNWYPTQPDNSGTNSDYVNVSSIEQWTDTNDALEYALLEFNTVPNLDTLANYFTPRNVIAGNRIGTDAIGGGELKNNGHGILLDAAQGVRIGGDTAIERNVISGNLFNGITAFGQNTRDIDIQGNYIGTDLSGTKALGNGGRGISIVERANDVRIGVSTDPVFGLGAANVISGNADAGIGFATTFPLFTTFQWKVINGGNDHFYLVAPPWNWLFSERAASASGGHLVSITSAAEQQFIQSVILPTISGVDPYIGVNDVAIEGAYGWTTNEPYSYSNWLPGQPDNLGNADHSRIYLANGKWDDLPGWYVYACIMEFDLSPDFATLASFYSGQSSVLGNFIGTDATGNKSLGNGAAGIVIDNACNVLVGGTSPNSANVIAGNTGDGIEIIGAYSAKNSIFGNHIQSNGGLGIDLNGDGVTLNDAGDVDQGVNVQLNFPTISKALSGDGTFVFGTYPGAANSTVALDFYASAMADPSGYGEGERYLGSTVVTTDASGMALFQLKLAAATAIGEVVAATATDSFGNTSEFSIAVAVAKAPPTAIFEVNAGQAQRSIVREFTVSFSESVSIPDGLSAAIQLLRTGPGGPMGIVGLSFTQMGNTVTAMINDPAYTENGSLIDGKYTLTLVATKISGVAGNLDGDVNGVGGDDQIVSFHRLFGDADGTGTVSASDFNAFRLAYGTGPSIFDFDNDGQTSAADFNQFRVRYGIGLVP